MFECVDGKCVGVNVSDQPPPATGVVVPSSVAYLLFRSPLIQISSELTSLPTVPLIVKSDLVETLALGAGSVIVTAGPAPVCAGAAAVPAAPPPLTVTLLNHQPLPPVWTYTLSVCDPPGRPGTEATKPDADQNGLLSAAPTSRSE